jgi:hypothetical protein
MHTVCITNGVVRRFHEQVLSPAWHVFGRLTTGTLEQASEEVVSTFREFPKRGGSRLELTSQSVKHEQVCCPPPISHNTAGPSVSLSVALLIFRNEPGI